MPVPRLCYRCHRRLALLWRNHYALCALCYARAERNYYTHHKADLKSSQKIEKVGNKLKILNTLIRDLMAIYRNQT